jgi:outer membrane protein OmpA-like peptidoglycan-associated protein
MTACLHEIASIGAIAEHEEDAVMNGNASTPNGPSLLQTVMNALTPDVLTQLSGFLRTTPDQSKAGMGVAVPAVIAGLVRHGSTADGARSVIDALTPFGQTAATGVEAATSPAQIIGGLTSGAADTTGVTQRLASVAFGDKVDRIVQTLARTIGVPADIMAKMVTAATALIAGVLGPKLAANSGSASWLSGFLTSQRSSIAALLPAGLSAILMPEDRTVTDAAARATGGHGAASVAQRPRSAWAIPAVVAVLALGGYWLARRGRHIPEEPTRPVAGEVTSPAMDELESSLSARDAPTEPHAIVFNEVTFDFGTAALTPQGRAAVSALATSLVAHPNAVVMLEGHTDGVGNADTNKKLSLDRAQAVKDVLVSRGVQADHLQVAGKGDDEPVASNATDEGRARNRRLAVIVLSTTGDTSPAH